MKALIVYYSRSGNNKMLALNLKDKLSCDVCEVSEKKKRNTISILLDFLFNRSATLSDYQIAAQPYDMFIFVAPVWGGKLASPIRAFIEREKGRIRHYAFISLCSGEDGQKERLTNELTAIMQHAPVEVTELCINRLLPEEQRNKIKYMFNFRVSDDELKQFDAELDAFVALVINAGKPA